MGCCLFTPKGVTNSSLLNRSSNIFYERYCNKNDSEKWKAIYPLCNAITESRKAERECLSLKQKWVRYNSQASDRLLFNDLLSYWLIQKSGSSLPWGGARLVNTQIIKKNTQIIAERRMESEPEPETDAFLTWYPLIHNSIPQSVLSILSTLPLTIMIISISLLQVATIPW